MSDTRPDTTPDARAATRPGAPADPSPYTGQQPPPAESSAQLRARIPGWGVDLDPKDRPSVPKLWEPRPAPGVHWDVPERQPEIRPRERSVEHAVLPPVFGTSCPPKGLSGVLRRLAYRRYSEGRAAHWLILVAADRVDAGESHLRALVSRRPDNPVTETGVRTEISHHGLRSRLGTSRNDRTHQALDPVVVAAPWLVAGGLGATAVARLVRRRRR